MSDVVLTKQINDIRVITLNRPGCLNALNNDLITGLLNALKIANKEPLVKVIIINGAGKAFCSGDDIEDTLGNINHENIGIVQNEYAENLQNVTREIICGNKFVIGAIHGWAVGAGFEWAINCDFSIWSNNAMAFFPEMKWGMFPTGGVTSLLPHIVGLVKAKELLLFGEKQSAEQLLSMGLAWKVVGQDKLMETAIEAAKTIAKFPEGSVQGLKQTINKACLNQLENTLTMESSEVIKAINHPDTVLLLEEFKKNVKQGFEHRI